MCTARDVFSRPRLIVAALSAVLVVCPYRAAAQAYEGFDYVSGAARRRRRPAPLARPSASSLPS